MVVEKDFGQPSVHDFFVNPIQSQSAVNPLCNGISTNSLGSDVTLSKYLNEKAISDMIQVNSEIKNILKKFRIPVKINMSILNNLVKNHLPQTKEIAMGIANHMPANFKPLINYKALAEATVLHDIAKVIIPETIINKQGSLTDFEREIMKEHAALSYELLKNTDLNEKTLNLIKNHHNPQSIEEQILSVADIYSALREHRSYKSAMSKSQALAIISKEVERGKFHSSIYQALIEYTNNNESVQSGSKWQIFCLKFANGFN